jgi:hypothetical protein
MKCNTCNSDMIPCEVIYQGKKYSTAICPRCSDDCTTIIRTMDLWKEKE